MKNINIAIPAYNAEDSIYNLATSLLKQKARGWKIGKLVIYSDNSKDKTVEILKRIKNKKLLVVDSKKRRGFGGAIEYIINNYKSDVTVILNDDIIIKDLHFIEKIANVFISNNVGLASVKLTTVAKMNFIQRAKNSTTRIYYEMRRYLPNKNNKFTIDGKVLAFSRKFANTLKFPRRKSLVGNVDAYLYFYCLKKDFEYRFIKNTQAYFVFPKTIGEMYNWITRNNTDEWLLKSTFGDIVDREYKIPFLYLLYPTVKEFIKNPVGLTFMVLMGIFSKRKAKVLAKSFNPRWESIRSTKQLKVSGGHMKQKV